MYCNGIKINELSNFWSIIDPEVSFDFLLGMFLSLFRRKLWNDNVKFINMKKGRGDLKNTNVFKM